MPSKGGRRGGAERKPRTKSAAISPGQTEPLMLVPTRSTARGMGREFPNGRTVLSPPTVADGGSGRNRTSSPNSATLSPGGNGRVVD